MSEPQVESGTKSKPILFSVEMVRAILEGRKTQTRRIVKLPDNIEHNEEDLELTRLQDGYPEGIRPVFGIYDEPNAFSVVNRFGKIGDRLWVKENHRLLDCTCTETCRRPGMVWYDADQSGYEGAGNCRLRPSIFMPKWASRITLEIIGVRVERVQDISEEDARAEGIEIAEITDDWSIHTMSKTGRKKTHYKFYGKELERLKQQTSNPVWSYETLWEKINGKGSWKENPWVWVISFKRINEEGRKA